MAQYTITGFDASAHMAEETQQASRVAAVGMYMSVVASVVFGFILLVAVTFAIPSTDGAIENLGFIVPWIWSESMGQNWAEALLLICVVAQFFCVTASITSASRMLFAFSRDGAVPGHRLWRQVGRNRVPQLSVVAIVVLSAAIMIPAYWNYFVGYLVGTGIAVIGLYIAFILPVILRFRLGDRFEHGAWALGRHYKWIDPIAILWVVFIVIIFLLPPYKSSVPWTDEFSWEALTSRRSMRSCQTASLRRVSARRQSWPSPASLSRSRPSSVYGLLCVHGGRRAVARNGVCARRSAPTHEQSRRWLCATGSAWRRSVWPSVWQRRWPLDGCCGRFVFETTPTEYWGHSRRSPQSCRWLC